MNLAVRFGWSGRILACCSRFVNPLYRQSTANVVVGWIEQDSQILLESLMPSGGVIFSDGIEADFLRFDSGAVASISAAAVRAQLVIGQAKGRR